MGRCFLRERARGGERQQLGSGGGPYWVKLVRIGNQFTGFSSADGVNWNQIATVSLAMSANAFAGLAVTAHNNLKVNTATFGRLAA